jgi:hypothetical protein
VSDTPFGKASLRVYSPIAAIATVYKVAQLHLLASLSIDWEIIDEVRQRSPVNAGDGEQFDDVDAALPSFDVRQAGLWPPQGAGGGGLRHARSFAGVHETAAQKPGCSGMQGRWHAAQCERLPGLYKNPIG